MLSIMYITFILHMKKMEISRKIIHLCESIHIMQVHVSFKADTAKTTQNEHDGNVDESISSSESIAVHKKESISVSSFEQRKSYSIHLG